jgi:two-component system chemotaxis sensor kinase CheA
MAIVQEHIENLSGLIFVFNTPRNGTTFKIELPVSLATFKGIIVSASGHDFILPIAHIDHSLRIEPADIRTAENRTVIAINGQAVSLMSLSDILQLPARPIPDAPSKHLSLPVIVLGSGDKTIACIVDRISDEQEVLVKSLGKQLKKVQNISGATILGNGQVVPILNVNDLISTASGRSISFAMAADLETKKHAVQKSILVVEDSFTSRTLLKNILEASGYRVSTAIDGEDGFQQLRTRDFDAVVSDVEMPKMDGFALTKKIRGDDILSRKPVVLVTSLDSREDREKGVDAGADAYIVKSSFDQSNLLEVLERLM